MQLLPSSQLSAKDKEALAAEDKSLRDRQPKSKQEALDNLAQQQTHLSKGSKSLGQKDLLGYAEIAAQLGIAIASVAAMTRKRQVFYMGVGVGVASILITTYAFISSYLLGN